MKIHEYQSKTLLKEYGVPIPRGIVAFKAEDAQKAHDTLKAKQVMVKAQVLAGGRGKAGGIQKSKSPQETFTKSKAFIGNSLKTIQTGSGAERIKSVLIEEMLPFDQELYIGIALNRSQGLPNLIFSESGGMDIETVAKEAPEKVFRITFKPTVYDQAFFESSFVKAGVAAELLPQLSAVAAQLAKVYVERDCTLVEINPLARQAQNLLALDAKIVMDDNALFRHPENAKLKDIDEDDAKERRAKKAGLSYVSLKGNIGCLVNGAGLAMATMDMIKQAGGQPANFLDVGGGANKDQVLEAFRIILEDPDVKAILINIFGGIMKCDIIAQALLDATAEIDIQIPLIVRLEGTNVEQGRALIKQSKVELHTAESLDEAANLAAKLVQGKR